MTRPALGRQAALAMVTVVLLLPVAALAPAAAGHEQARASGRALETDVGIWTVGYTSNGTTKLHPNLGDHVVFSVTVKNTGDDNATWVNLSVVFDNGTPPSTPVGTINVSGVFTNVSVAPDGFVLNVTWWTTDQPLTAGTDYTFRFNATTHNDTDLGNNTYTQVISFDPPLYDLVTVASLDAQPQEVEVGSPVWTEMVVRNVGNNASVAQTLYLHVDGVELANVSHDELYPFPLTGDEYVLNATWQTTGVALGAHEVCASVQPFDNVRCVTVDVTAIKLPDLVIESFRVDPTQALVGEDVNFVATIANTGLDPAGPFNVTFYVSPAFQTLNESRVDGGLGVGASTTLTFRVNTTELGVGSHKVVASVDSNHEVIEGSIQAESNNGANVSLNLTSLPDLSAGAPTFLVSGVGATSALVGQQVRVLAAIANLGYATSPDGAQVALIVDGGAALEVRLLLPIGPQNTFNKTFDWNTTTASTGLHDLCIVVDLPAVVDELIETNNRACAKFLVEAEPSVPDFEVVALTVTPTAADVGGPLDLSTTVAVEGLVGELQNALRYLFGPAGSASTDLIATQAVFLTEDQPLNVLPLTWFGSGGYAPGPYDLCVEVDPQDAVTETDETNNRDCTMVTLRDPVIEEFALEVVEVRFPNAKDGTDPNGGRQVSITVGTPLQVEVVLRNTGNRNATATYLVFYIDEQRVACTLIPVVPPGGNVTVPYTYSPNEEGILNFQLDIREQNCTGRLRTYHVVPTTVAVRAARQDSGFLPTELLLGLAVGIVLLLVAAILYARRPKPKFLDYNAAQRARSGSGAAPEVEDEVDFTRELDEE